MHPLSVVSWSTFTWEFVLKNGFSIFRGMGAKGPVMGIKGDKNDLEKEMEDLNQETGVHLRVPERLGAV